MKIIRCLAAVGVIAGASFWSAPAQAHHSIEPEPCEASGPGIGGPFLSPSPGATPTPSATPPPTDCVPEEGSAIREIHTLSFVSTTDNVRPIERVTVTVLGDEAELADFEVVLFEETYTREQGVTRFDQPVEWDSRAQTPLNGRYKLLIEVRTYEAPILGEAHTASEEVADLRVDNPPVTPAAPTIAAVTPSSVTVQWAAAPEPDVQNYVLFRAVTDDDTAPAPSSFDLVTTTTEETSYRDSNVQTGKTYWYIVQVRRRSVVEPELGSWSALSPISGAGAVEADGDGGDGGDGDGGDGGAGEDNSGGNGVRQIPFRRVTSPGGGDSSSVPDAPFTYSLPFEDENAVPEGDIAEPSEPGGDPRGPVLPVAVGAFLLSSALTFGRMPY